jgi:hypothetical protein
MTRQRERDRETERETAPDVYVDDVLVVIRGEDRGRGGLWTSVSAVGLGGRCAETESQHHIDDICEAAALFPESDERSLARLSRSTTTDLYLTQAALRAGFLSLMSETSDE